MVDGFRYATRSFFVCERTMLPVSREFVGRVEGSNGRVQAPRSAGVLDCLRGHQSLRDLFLEQVDSTSVCAQYSPPEPQADVQHDVYTDRNRRREDGFYYCRPCGGANESAEFQSEFGDSESEASVLSQCSAVARDPPDVAMGGRRLGWIKQLPTPLEPNKFRMLLQAQEGGFVDGLYINGLCTIGRRVKLSRSRATLELYCVGGYRCRGNPDLPWKEVRGNIMLRYSTTWPEHELFDDRGFDFISAGYTEDCDAHPPIVVDAEGRRFGIGRSVFSRTGSNAEQAGLRLGHHYMPGFRAARRISETGSIYEWLDFVKEDFIDRVERGTDVRERKYAAHFFLATFHTCAYARPRLGGGNICNIESSVSPASSACTNFCEVATR